MAVATPKGTATNRVIMATMMVVITDGSIDGLLLDPCQANIESEWYGTHVIKI